MTRLLADIGRLPQYLSTIHFLKKSVFIFGFSMVELVCTRSFRKIYRWAAKSPCVTRYRGENEQKCALNLRRITLSKMIFRPVRNFAEFRTFQFDFPFRVLFRCNFSFIFRSAKFSGKRNRKMEIPRKMEFFADLRVLLRFECNRSETHFQDSD